MARAWKSVVARRRIYASSVSSQMRRSSGLRALVFLWAGHWTDRGISGYRASSRSMQSRRARNRRVPPLVGRHSQGTGQRTRRIQAAGTIAAAVASRLMGAASPDTHVMPMRLTLFVIIMCVSLASCAHVVEKPVSGSTTAPAELLGRFSDDYGDVYEVSAERWLQSGNGRYRIVEWDRAQQDLIAQNDMRRVPIHADAGRQLTKVDGLALGRVRYCSTMSVVGLRACRAIHRRPRYQTKSSRGFP